MNTEHTDKNGGTLLYDAECAFCTKWARRGEQVLGSRGFTFRPLPQAAEEMKLVTPSGETFGGAMALVHLARQVWWAWPLWAASRVPFVMRFLNRGYRKVAARRHCLNERCGAR